MLLNSSLMVGHEELLLASTTNWHSTYHISLNHILYGRINMFLKFEIRSAVVIILYEKLSHYIHPLKWKLDKHFFLFVYSTNLFISDSFKVSMIILSFSHFYRHNLWHHKIVTAWQPSNELYIEWMHCMHSGRDWLNYVMYNSKNSVTKLQKKSKIHNFLNKSLVL